MAKTNKSVRTNSESRAIILNAIKEIDCVAEPKVEDLLEFINNCMSKAAANAALRELEGEGVISRPRVGAHKVIKLLLIQRDSANSLINKAFKPHKQVT